MKIFIEAQVMALLGAFLLGCCIGFLYDVLRIFRVRCRWRPLTGVFDILFWVFSVPMVFFHALTIGDGTVRIYMLLGIVGGVSLYFLLLSRPILFLGYKAADFIGIMFYILAKPLQWIWFILKKIQEKKFSK